MQLNIDSIRIDGGTQPRAELHTDVVNEYAELMRGGAAFPPVSVFYDGQDYWLADGFHRFHAWRHARPGQPIEAGVFQGTLEDARWHSYGVNQTHGLRRTNADKEQAVRRALQHPKALMLSNRRIAEHCGVNEVTIRRYRRQWEAQDEQFGECGEPVLYASRPRLRVGLDGRVIDTASIGSARRLRAQASRLAGAVPAAAEEGRQLPASNSVTVDLPSTDPRVCARRLLERLPFEFLQKVFLNVFSLHRQHLQRDTA
jgi:transposase-like protein